MNELDKNRPGTSHMSERFGPNFAPGSFALQQSIRLVYTLRALSRGRNRATRATRDNQGAHTHSATETKHNSQPETMKGSWPLLLPRRHRRRCCCCCCCCCCCAATVLLLLHDPRCIAVHNPSQQAVSRFVFFGTHAEASNGTAAAAAAAVAAAASRSSNRGGQNICCLLYTSPSPRD